MTRAIAPRWRVLWRGGLALVVAVPLLLALLVAVYGAASWALVLFPAHRQATAQQHAPAEPAAASAYVAVQGVHADLVLPLRGPGGDWAHVFARSAFVAAPPEATHIAIGWGDRAFYLNTPRWRDLTAQRALQALSGSGRSLLHVSYLRPVDLYALAQRSALYTLPSSASVHLALVQQVREAVQWQGGQAVAVHGAHYTHNDAFFEARGQYHAFQTCNSWVGQGLRRAGVTVSRWTPFASQVVWHLQTASPDALPGWAH